MNGNDGHGPGIIENGFICCSPVSTLFDSFLSSFIMDDIFFLFSLGKQ